MINKDIILDWIESLRPSSRTCVDPQADTPGPGDLPGLVARIIKDKAEAAATFHDGIVLTGGSGSAVPLKELFQRPSELMHCLVGNGWIVPGEDDRSMFVTRLLLNSGPMTGVFSADEIETIRRWIREGAHAPAGDGVQPFAVAPFGLPVTQKASWATRRQLIGMGSVH